jgi:hypothetical protein
MKKSLILSSVAAIAVVGMLSLSGCGGNSGKSSKNQNTFDPSYMAKSTSGQIVATIDKDGKSSKKNGAQKDKNGVEKNKFTYSLNKVKGTRGCETDATTGKQNDGCNKTCEQAAEVNDPCKVEVERSCATGVKGEKLDYSGSVSDAFKKLDANADENMTFRYAGLLNVFTKDDINEGRLYLTADLDCSLGRDGRGIYINKDTTPDGSRVVVVVEDKDGKKNQVTGTVQYHDADKHHAYVVFEDNVKGIDLKGLDTGSITAYFFVQEKNVIPDQGDVWSGATGGDATGAGS